MANEPLIGGGNGAAAAAVKDVTTASFMAEVVDASFEQPVIVDFWAPWCGPCKQLGPILEKVVRGANGAVRMVKLNIDENPEIAQQMRVQSIPAVYAFKDGRPVDGFVGAVPESQIKQFVQRLGGGRNGPSPIDEALAMAKEAVQAGDHDGAAGDLSNRSCSTMPRISRRWPALRARWSRAANSTKRASCSGACRRKAPTTPKSPRRAPRSSSRSRRRRPWARPAHCSSACSRTRTTTRRAWNWRPRCSAPASARRPSTSS